MYRGPDCKVAVLLVHNYGLVMQLLYAVPIYPSVAHVPHVERAVSKLT